MRLLSNYVQYQTYHCFNELLQMTKKQKKESKEIDLSAEDLKIFAILTSLPAFLWLHWWIDHKIVVSPPVFWNQGMA